MARYVIERDIPAIGSSTHEEMKMAARMSISVLQDMKKENKDIEWEHSYITANKSFCIYNTSDPDLIMEHGKRSGYPVTLVTRTTYLVNPLAL
ncbi:DUF4242 domain-containing protein [Oceanospirillaceae bacterium]|jgi:hypothetical protein|uniref:nickel-binding protein n=1 Tax=Candidatus Njordibacter sp. Uisw_058 TaxID=3230974 RepID=UPI001DBDD839|nr:DUF4242 domain-containing protein [Oceanospirillaceae bacterium]CAI8410861.1 MAG: Uncharacterised protein [Oceanospirillaceae bacterium UBA2001]MBT4997401.1 DUF4242 domain-containing protein [Oceanospirillaceae bacterium]MBT5628697.1 DUF4242 domain-containing protein [Oceanospirillaceae bacterium]MBT6101830.1 DUF4242 domain-containing protein [Oceanospirillaceae bacterium]|tara:strand:+ start:218 stop:496 length:279 start_codon:yes stop_codon:yes gene_type:complete